MISARAGAPSEGVFMTESKLWHFLVNCFRSSRCFAHLEQIHDGSYRARDAKVRGGFNLSIAH